MDNFWEGFEKKGNAKVRKGAWIGMLAGGGLATVYAQHVANQAMDKFKNHKGAVDAREAFDKIKHLSPGTELVTEKELRKHIKSMKGIWHKHTLSQYADLLSKGNAFASHPELGGINLLMPEILREKKIIMCGNRVHPSVLAHEMGHIVDYDEISRKPFFKKFLSKYIRGVVGREEDAWKKAPGKGHEELQGDALKTYKTSVYGLPLGMGVGALLGGLVGAKLHKRAEEDPILEWETESVEADKKAKNKKEPGPDLTTMLHGFPPDTYWRSWP